MERVKRPTQGVCAHQLGRIRAGHFVQRLRRLNGSRPFSLGKASMQGPPLELRDGGVGQQVCEGGGEAEPSAGDNVGGDLAHAGDEGPGVVRGRRSPFTSAQKDWIASKCKAVMPEADWGQTGVAPALSHLKYIALEGVVEGQLPEGATVEQVRQVARFWRPTPKLVRVIVHLSMHETAEGHIELPEEGPKLALEVDGLEPVRSLVQQVLRSPHAPSCGLGDLLIFAVDRVGRTCKLEPLSIYAISSALREIVVCHRGENDCCAPAIEAGPTVSLRSSTASGSGELLAGATPPSSGRKRRRCL